MSSTLRDLCVICVSAVKKTTKYVNRRDAEDAEVTQRNFKRSMLSRLPHCLLVLVLTCTCVYAQTEKAPAEDKAQPVTIVLATGNTLLVDEVSESTGGYWYKRGNITTFLDRERVTRIEHPKPVGEAAVDAAAPGKWTIAEAHRVEKFFMTKFKRPLPLTAFGQSDLHTRWGLDHRNGMDVGVHPDSIEGRGLIEFLRAESIPFLVFRGPVPGVATGPHIHIGNRSSRSYGR